MERFDPGALAHVHDDKSEAGVSYALRRGLSLATDAAVRLSRPGEVWIDAGCGSGHLTARLAAAGRTAVGMDGDQEIAQAARARWAETPFTAGDATMLPLGESCADGLVAVSLAGCLDDFPAFLAEARRILKPRGVLVFTVSNRESLLLRVNGRLRRILDTHRDPRRYRLYSADEIADMLREAHLQILGIRRYGYVINLGSRLLPPATLTERFEKESASQGSRWARNLLITAQR